MSKPFFFIKYRYPFNYVEMSNHISLNLLLALIIHLQKGKSDNCNLYQFLTMMIPLDKTDENITETNNDFLARNRFNLHIFPSNLELRPHNR